MTTLDIVVLGLSITSSWGNDHATTYRGLVRGLVGRGHCVTFLERDVPGCAAHRDLPQPRYGRTHLYGGLEELRDRFTPAVRSADLVVLGSCVPEGIAVGDWLLAEARGVRAFYDLDTPRTLAQLAAGHEEYLAARQIPRWDLYLSCVGGNTLRLLEVRWGARHATSLYCAVDASLHRPGPERAARWDLGYLGSYSADRQPKLEAMLLEPARARPAQRFAVAGVQYPEALRWPENVERLEHVPPAERAGFYATQRFTLNLTRADGSRAGFAPSARLFEAAACAAPIVTDVWSGLDRFFQPGGEILLARTAEDVLYHLDHVSEEARRAIGARARERVLAAHTAEHRAAELERLFRVAALRSPVTAAVAAR